MAKIDGSPVRWTGGWFMPEIGETYYLPENVANHREHAGRKGECVDIRSNGSGMVWALITFSEAVIDRPLTDWIRTKYLMYVDSD